MYLNQLKKIVVSALGGFVCVRMCVCARMCVLGEGRKDSYSEWGAHLSSG